MNITEIIHKLATDKDIDDNEIIFFIAKIMQAKEIEAKRQQLLSQKLMLPNYN